MNYKLWLIIVIVFITLILFIKQYNSLDPSIEIINIRDNRHLKYNKLLKENEVRLRNWYSFGLDKFYLDHGNDYCKFFRRLGELNMMICQSNNKIIGTCAMILRKIPIGKTWYLADFKIEPEFRGLRLPYHMTTNDFFNKYWISNRCYGIAMDEPSKDSWVVNISRKASHLHLFKLHNAGKLYIYSVNYNQMKYLHQVLEITKGKIAYLSLKGVKDIILQSTLKPMKLLHVQWGRNNKYNTTQPQPGYTHMFCLHENDPLKKILDKYNIKTDTTATIVQYNMDNVDWSFILTSDI